MRRLPVNAIDAMLLLLLACTVWRVAAGWTNAERTARTSETVDNGVAPVSVGGTFALPHSIRQQPGPFVVLVVSELCDACRQSLGFYRRLGLRIATSPSPTAEVRARMVAVTDQSASRIEAWLRDNGVSVDQVLHAPSLRALGLRATPTVLIVGRDGRITDLAMGRLSPGEEVLFTRRALGIQTEVPLNKTLVVPKIDERQARKMVLDNHAVILDVRERSAFRTSGSHGAKNIPLHEMQERLLAELDPTTPVVIDCRLSPASLCEPAGVLLVQKKFSSVSALVR